MPKRNYKYIKLILGWKQREAFMQDLAIVRTKRLHKVVNSFATSIDRLSALSLSMSEIAYRVRREQWSMDYSIFKVHHIIPEPLTNFNISPECRVEFDRQIEKFNSLPRPKLSEFMATWGAGYIIMMLDASTGMRESIEALLCSVIIESWTTFETLSSDLLVSAVDVGPARLRQRMIRRAVKPEWSHDEQEDVEDLEYDPAKKFGSALLESGGISFRSLRLIKKNYELVFGAKIKTAFEAEDGYIDVLSAYRNALVHNAGRADRTFTKQVKGFPQFEKIKKKTKLALDGELVAKFKTTAASVGAKLIHFVDDVLTPIQRCL